MRRLAVFLLAVAVLAAVGRCGAPAADRPVLVYATHSDEGYAGGGTVADVARQLALALRAAGFRGARLLPQSFLPYRSAYLRSRAALAPHLWRRPLLLIDVHRDAAAPGSYAGMVGGRPAARILLVVGRTSGRTGRALRTARRVAAAGASLCPGLIKGIYVGPGDYNQDLAAGALLVEVGNADTPLPDALRSARLLARVLAAAFLHPLREPSGSGAGPSRAAAR